MYDKDLSIKEIQDKIRNEHKERNNIKSMAESLSIEYMHRLAMAKEDAV